jgi:hypothetical protein
VCLVRLEFFSQKEIAVSSGNIAHDILSKAWTFIFSSLYVHYYSVSILFMEIFCSIWQNLLKEGYWILMTKWGSELFMQSVI